MENIKKVLEGNDPSIESLMKCLEEVKMKGDVAVVKFDGERDKNQYTVFISFANDKKKEMIRVDENNLKCALSKVLEKYLLA